MPTTAPFRRSCRLHGVMFVCGWRNVPAIVKPLCRRLRKITSLTVLALVTSPNFEIIQRTLIHRVPHATLNHAVEKQNFSILYGNFFRIDIAHDK